MNLLELMLKEEVEWPVGALIAMQDSDGRVKWSEKHDVFYKPGIIFGVWQRIGNDSVSEYFKNTTQADDWPTRIITHEEYQAAGGKMAVDAVGFTPFVSVEDAQECRAEHAATAKQAAPKGSGNPILGMVLADLTNRALEGKEKYGEPLKAHNGRNPLWDAYQEALDLAMYLRQAIEEQQ